MHLHLKKWLRLPINLFNVALYMIPMINFCAGSFEKVPEVFNQLVNGANFFYMGFAVNMFLFELYNHKVMVQYVEQLSFQYDRILLHQKYHLIIHNLTSSIVTIKDHSISYFNRNGEGILRENV